MTRYRRVAGIAAALVVLVAVGGCSGSSDNAGDARDVDDSSATSSTTAPSRETKAWVARWRPVLTDEYAPAQQAFLGAVQGAKVVDVQQAALGLGAASTSLLQALRTAGAPPDSARDAADRLETALAIEVALIQEIRRVCTGSDDTCQAAVSRYGDNNSQEIVPALVALAALDG